MWRVERRRKATETKPNRPEHPAAATYLGFSCMHASLPVACVCVCEAVVNQLFLLHWGREGESMVVNGDLRSGKAAH